MKYQIKQADKSNLSDLYGIAQAMGASKAANYFERSLDLNESGVREIYIIWIGQDAVGYVMLSYSPKYAYYRALNIPEIQDLNILPSYRQRGLGRTMIEHCENLCRDKGYERIGIGVGLTPGYGAAQRLYVKMGYVPDGFGVTYDRQIISHGEFRSFDDDVSLMFEKAL